MRLAYVTSSFPRGPGEAFILPEVLELGRQGHEVWVVPMHPRGLVVHAEALQLGERAVVQPLLSREVLRGALLEFLRSPVRALRALALLLTWKPRHLLKNLSVYPKGLWLAGLVRRLGVEHIHAHWAATTASMAMVAGEVSGVPWSFTAHRWDIEENNLLARKCQHAAFARFISQSGMELARQNGAHATRARLLHMGVRLPVTGEKRSGSVTDPPFATVLCPAALIPRKGHIYLLHAVARLKARGLRLKLWLAGDGELRDQLASAVESLELVEDVCFLGQLSQRELLEIYIASKVDLVVLPSLHEGIPVALMEAMSLGIPAVATEVGGIPELLGGEAGLLVPPKDPEALAKAIARLATDPDLRRTLGQRGRERVEKEFSVEAVARRLAEWFAEGRER